MLHLLYENLEKNKDPESYAFFLTNRSSKFINNLVFGKYDSVSKEILERIHIKYIEKYDEIIKFFDDLSFISSENLPAYICLDRMNLFFNLVIFKSLINFI
jgi:hypothetical protein